MWIYHTDDDVDCVCVCKNQIVDGKMKGEQQMTRTSGHSILEFSERGSNPIFFFFFPWCKTVHLWKGCRTTHCLAKSSVWKPFAWGCKGFRGFLKDRELFIDFESRYSLGNIYGVLIANWSCLHTFGIGKEFKDEKERKRKATSLPKVDPMMCSGWPGLSASWIN